MDWETLNNELRYASSDDTVCGETYLDAAEQLLSEGRKTRKPEYLAIAWYALAMQQSEDAHSADKGAEYLSPALEQAKICEDYEIINASYILLGQLLCSQRIYSQAMEYFLQAVRAGKKCPNPAWSVTRPAGRSLRRRALFLCTARKKGTDAMSVPYRNRLIPFSADINAFTWKILRKR